MAGAPTTDRAAIVIPARHGSTRYPGKPLVRLRGHDGTERTLIEWTWRTAGTVPGIDAIWVATDDRRIADEVERFGGHYLVTTRECANGTERCAAAVAALPHLPNIIINLQGDAPLTPPAVVQALIARLRDDPQLTVATPAVRCSPSVLRHLRDDQAAGRVGGTTVVFDAAGDALYFSKRVIPYTPDRQNDETPVHLHMGVYAYRRSALAAYQTLAPSPLEEAEGLEQLRFLHGGVRVGVVVCPAPEWGTIELNNPGDLALVEAALAVRDGRGGALR